MENILATIVENAPNLIGLVVLAYVLARQNDRMLTALLGRVSTLEQQVQELKIEVQAARQITPAQISRMQAVNPPRLDGIPF